MKDKTDLTLKLTDETNKSFILNLHCGYNAEHSSRPLTPSPLYEGGGGAKITFDSEIQ